MNNNQNHIAHPVILIVDDNPKNLQVLGQLLKENHFNIEFATNGKSALNWLNTREFDLILLDINMPDMSGFEVCSAIRSNPDLNKMPIIFLSADNERETILKGFSLGAQDYVAKPFDSGELISRVKTHLALKQSIENLDELNRSLEEKVSERTKQLTEANEKLEAALERAQESDRLKSAFLSNIGHEIRTPMNGILGFTELLKGLNLSGEEQRDYIGYIEKSAARMMNIINKIVDISIIESKHVQVCLLDTNINELIENIIKLHRFVIEQKGLKILFNKALQGNQAIVKTDDQKLFAILSNLFENAIKFTQKGSIEIGYRVINANPQVIKSPLNEPSKLEFYVKDTGIGIIKEKQDVIFEHFRQENESLDREYDGAGLGLSISKAYAEMLGGKIRVESEPGKGSIFYFTIQYFSNPVEQNNIQRFNLSVNEKFKPNKLKILIAEDDKGSAMYLLLILKPICQEIFTVSTGFEAVETCRANPDIDLMLMDIHMPEMNGYDAAMQIRKFNNQVIIIAQTAFALEGDREKALNAGCDEYISKPIKKDLLLKIISEKCGIPVSP